MNDNRISYDLFFFLVCLLHHTVDQEAAESYIW